MGYRDGAVALAVILGCVGLVELLFGRSQIDYLRVSSSTGLLKENHENHQGVHGHQKSGRRLFYILPLPELTTWLAGNYTKQATEYYKHEALNEEMAEVWLYRAFMNHSDRTDNPEDADIVIICGYLHLNLFLVNNVDERANKSELRPMNREEWGRLVMERIIPGKIHTIATPTWNPTVSEKIGIKHLSLLLKSYQVSTMALGFERNELWSHVPTDQIVPIPYVATPSVSREELGSYFDSERTDNFLFYTGDHRKHADDWAGCNRSRLVEKLEGQENMDVRLRTKGERISQDDYNRRMLSSDFCLILCGDTPTSRSLTSAVLYGCVPVIIGSRLRGLCEPPCHKGWGWTIANRSHIPFSNLVDWDFPTLPNEEKFAADPMLELAKVFANETQKRSVRTRLKEWHLAWVYGWGDPLTSDDFGLAADYAWKSLVESAFR